jgi:hypothetical protein
MPATVFQFAKFADLPFRGEGKNVVLFAIKPEMSAYLDELALQEKKQSGKLVGKIHPSMYGICYRFISLVYNISIYSDVYHMVYTMIYTIFPARSQVARWRSTTRRPTIGPTDPANGRPPCLEPYAADVHLDMVASLEYALPLQYLSPLDSAGASVLLLPGPSGRL